MANTNGSPVDKDPVVAVARARFKRAAEAEDAQRKAIVSAKKFRSGDQWPDEIKIQRQGGPAIQGQAAQPPRPCLTIDRLSQPVRQVSNAIRSANFGITVLPNGHGADDETADIFKGIIRRIQSQARGEAPIDWAADSAAEGGIGWFRIRTDYVPVPEGYIGPMLKDQDIKLERIANNLTVYCDPDAKKPTREDARWMFVTEELSKDEAKRKYGLDDDDLRSLDDFMATGDDDKSWVTEKTVRVAEYWRVEDERLMVCQLEDGSFVPKDAVPKGVEPVWTREVLRPVVKMSTINAVREIKAHTWVGSRIPLIPILGEELNVDGLAMLRGIIAEGMDGQRMVNYMYSAAIETVALAPKAPLIVADDQVADYKAIWQTANRFNYAYLPYKPITSGGHVVPPPVRDNTEPAIQAMAFMLDKSEEAIKATTGIYDPSLGNNPEKQSGRAIIAQQKQAEMGNSNYLDNTRRALVYAGEQLVEIIPKIYDRPGRVLQILGVDDTPQQILVGQPFTQGPKGVPQPVPEGQPFEKGLHKFYDLSQGQYAVTVDVGQNYTTQRKEGAALLGEIIASKPEMMQVIGDIWARDLDIPGAQEMADRLKKLLPPQLQEKPGQPDIPPQVQQQLQQMGQMIEQMTQELNAKNQLIETDQIKAQQQVAIKQQDLEAKRLQEEAETARETARLQVEQSKLDQQTALEMRKLEVQLEIEMAKLGSSEAMARAQVEQQELHHHDETALRAAEMAHETAENDIDRQTAAQESEAGRQFEADQAERNRQIASVQE